MNAIYQFFGRILEFFNSFTGHYLLALFIFALMVKILLLPFGIKQQKNSVKQAKFRPRERAIRNKYKGRTDAPTQQKMQNEIMELYQQEGYNPMGGCLPLLIQLPIIWILYQVITNPLRYICRYSTDILTTIGTYLKDSDITSNFINAKTGVFSGQDIKVIQYLSENIGGINEALESAGLSTINLSDLPNFGLFGDATALARNPYFWSILLLVPVLNFAFTLLSTFVTKKLTFQPMQDQPGQAGTMKMMNIFMSLMTAVIAFSMPAAIGIYWIFNTLLGMLQQFILYKAIPLPTFTEEDYKAAEREYAGKAPKREQVEKTKAALARPMVDDECADLGEYHSVWDEEREPAPKKDPVLKDEDGKVIKKAPLKKNGKSKKDK